jgi:hypothetical protein
VVRGEEKPAHAGVRMALFYHVSGSAGAAPAPPLVDPEPGCRPPGSPAGDNRPLEAHKKTNDFIISDSRTEKFHGMGVA